MIPSDDREIFAAMAKAEAIKRETRLLEQARGLAPLTWLDALKYLIPLFGFVALFVLVTSGRDVVFLALAVVSYLEWRLSRVAKRIDAVVALREQSPQPEAAA